MNDKTDISGYMVSDNLSVKKRLELLLKGETLVHGTDYNLEFKFDNNMIITNGFNPKLTISMIFDEDIKMILK